MKAVQRSHVRKPGRHSRFAKARFFLVSSGRAYFWEVSALKGDSINEMFQRMVFLVLDRRYSDSEGATKANAGTNEKSTWESDTLPKGLLESPISIMYGKSLSEGGQGWKFCLA